MRSAKELTGNVTSALTGLGSGLKIAATIPRIGKVFEVLKKGLDVISKILKVFLNLITSFDAKIYPWKKRGQYVSAKLGTGR